MHLASSLQVYLQRPEGPACVWLRLPYYLATRFDDSTESHTRRRLSPTLNLRVRYPVLPCLGSTKATRLPLVFAVPANLSSRRPTGGSRTTHVGP